MGYLVLDRNLNESVIVGEGDNEVIVSIKNLSAGQVSLAFSAPRHIRIDREEVRNKILDGVPFVPKNQRQKCTRFS